MTNTMARIFPNWEDVSMRVVDYEALPWAPTYLKDFCVIPASVNYVSEAFKIPSYLNPDAAKLHMLSEVLSNGTLHKLIREKGGAYGAFAGCDPLNGVMTLSSYRDPKNLETYENFERAILTINEGKFKDQELDEAKMSMFGRMDKPVAPYRRGFGKWCSKIDFEAWQTYRAQLLAVSRDDIIEVSEKYILEALKKDETSKVVFGNMKGDLESLMERGWKIERFVENLSMNEANYTDDAAPKESKDSEEEDTPAFGYNSN